MSANGGMEMLARKPRRATEVSQWATDGTQYLNWASRCHLARRLLQQLRNGKLQSPIAASSYWEWAQIQVEVGRIALCILRNHGMARRLARQLAVTIPRHLVPAPWKIAVKASFGEMFFDLVHSDSRLTLAEIRRQRLQSKNIALLTLLIMAIVDDYIDTPRSRSPNLEEKVLLLDEFLLAISTGGGIRHDVAPPCLAGVHRLCIRLHNELRELPQRKCFLRELHQMVDGVKYQLMETDDIGFQFAHGIGAHTTAITAPAAFTHKCPAYLTAIKELGSATQFLDDIIDFGNDRNNDVATAITSAPEPLEAMQTGFALALVSMERSIAILPQAKRFRLKAMYGILSLIWGSPKSHFARLFLGGNSDGASQTRGLIGPSPKT